MSKEVSTLKLKARTRWWFGFAFRALLRYSLITRREPPKWAVPALCRYGIWFEVQS